jgi:hypothetical protein
LLGDDINIFDEDVAHSYLSIMDKLGVGINLSKSVVAKTDCFEFAKVTGYHGINVSAISWRMWISQNTLIGRVNITHKLLSFLTPKKLFGYIQHVNRASKYKEGSMHLPLLTLLTM